MRTSAVLIPVLLLGLAGGAAWFAQQSTGDADPTEGRTPSTPDARPKPTELQGAVSAGGSAAGNAETPAAGSTAPKPDPTGRPPIRATGPADDPVGDLAKRLGWKEGEDASAVFDWNREVETDREEFAQSHGHPEAKFDTVREAARRFNDVMTGRREKLVRLLGERRANEVLQQLPIYVFDLAAGSWHRVDATGQPVPFEDREREHVWENFRRIAR